MISNAQQAYYNLAKFTLGLGTIDSKVFHKFLGHIDIDNSPEDWTDFYSRSVAVGMVFCKIRGYRI